MKQRAKNRTIYLMLSTILLSAAMLIVSLTLLPSNAKYVTEVGDDTSDFEMQMPADIKSQQDLFNAITSGYSYVKLSDELEGSLIMTGEGLELTNNLIIDLNGKEITRNDRKSILTVPSGQELTVIDTGTNSVGGLYNPIGSVLNVSGGKLSFYGGKVESGPRPSEYYGKIKQTTPAKAVSEVRTVTELNSDGTIKTDANKNPVTKSMPVFPIRASGSGNVYFDVPFVSGGQKYIERDTYCFVATSSGSDNELALLDVSKAKYSYKYVASTDGTYLRASDGNEIADTELEVMVFAYEDDIAASMTESETDPVTRLKTVPNYAAVSMQSGELNVSVRSTDDSTITESGSFYSYFGTWHTYCVYMNSGVMNVSTSGKFETVDPDSLTAFDKAVDTQSNSAKYAENACILAAGGTLNINKIGAANSFNGSVISVSGGTVNIKNTKIKKDITFSHFDSPFDVDEPETEEHGSEFPAGRQYRDAALFVNGGTLDIDNTDVTVEKAIDTKYPVTGVRPQTSFGILSRGRSTAQLSKLEGENLNLTLNGAHSYGIYATRGTVSLTGTGDHNSEVNESKQGRIVLSSDEDCYGVYAENRTSKEDNATKIMLKNYAIKIGEEKTYVGSDAGTSETTATPSGLVSGRRAASIGVYLDSSKFDGGGVLLDNTGIHSQEMGVAVNDGSLTFKNGGTIHAYNASAVCLVGGNIDFENNSATTVPSAYEIECYINRLGTGLSESSCAATEAQATAAGSHRYELYLPYSPDENYANENGIRVVGGALKADGKLNMTFRGLYNDFKQYKNRTTNGNYTNYDKVTIKSFAVACVDSETGRDENAVPANISIKYAEITSKVGGGVKVQGGTITLGDDQRTADDYKEDIKIHTKGHVHLDTAYYAYSEGDGGTGKGTTWQFFPNLSGGHAVIARGGNMVIYNGTYTANNSNGIAASDEGKAISIDIYNGTFTGNMYDHGGKNGTPSQTGHNWDTNYPAWGDKQLQRVQATGPATYYGLKVLGAAHINIKNGVFGGRNGGAFVRGNVAEQASAVVKIERGTFNSGSHVNNGVTTASDCFNAADYSTVYFGTLTKTELADMSDSEKQNLIKLTAENTTVSVDSFESGKDGHVEVYLFYGSYMLKEKNKGKPFGIIMLAGDLQNSKAYIYNYGSGVLDQGTAVDWAEGPAYLHNGRIRYDDTRFDTTKHGVQSSVRYYAEDANGPYIEDANGNRVPT